MVVARFSLLTHRKNFHKFVMQHKRRKILKIRFEVKETRLAVRPEKMVSTFPVSLSKEKYRTRPDFKGFEIWTRLARYLLSDAPSLHPPVEKRRSAIRGPRFKKPRTSPEKSGLFFLHAHICKRRAHFRDGSCCFATV